MKKIGSVVLASAMALILTACDNQAPKPDVNNNDNAATTTTTTDTTTTQPAADATATPVAPASEDKATTDTMPAQE